MANDEGPRKEGTDAGDATTTHSNPNSSSSIPNSRVKILQNYLKRVEQQVETREWPRCQCSTCPNSSKSKHLYCCDCCQLLIPPQDWPSAIRDKTLRLPFAVDILLQDRRASSTGVQIATLLRHHCEAFSGGWQDREEQQQQQQQKENEERELPMVRLIDLEKEQPQKKPNRKDDNKPNQMPPPTSSSLPDYIQERAVYGEQALVLFPSKQSVPLSTYYHHHGDSQSKKDPEDTKDTTITETATTEQSQRQGRLRLIVLDCRWNQYNRILALLPTTVLPLVHLDNPPDTSFYWRWHNAGTGCLSTAEAVFWAAWQWQISHEPKHEDNGNNDDTSRHAREQNRPETALNNETEEDRDATLSSSSSLLDILWLFAVQRALIQKRFRQETEERTIPHLPFSDQAKEHARELRRRQGEEHHHHQGKNSQAAKIK